MSLNPKNLTVNYKDLLKNTSISERVSLAKTQSGQELLSALTPTELSSIFPDYYKRSIPDVSGFLASRKASTQNTTVTNGPVNRPANYNSTATPKVQSPSAQNNTPVNVNRQQVNPNAANLNDKQKLIRELADEYGINPRALAGIFSIESGITTNIRGGAGKNYYGVFQLQSQQIPGLTQKAGLGALNAQQYQELSLADQLKVYREYIKGAGITKGFFTGDERQDAARLWALQLSPGNAKRINYNDPNAVISATSQAAAISQRPGLVTVGSVQAETIKRGKIHFPDELLVQQQNTTTVGTPQAIQQMTSEQTNQNRPYHIRGQLTLPQITDPKDPTKKIDLPTFDVGSGGTKNGSVPYGIHDLSPLRDSGPIITNAYGQQKVVHVGDQNTDFQKINDPRFGNRTAIQIHSTSDIQRLISQGCIVIPQNRHQEFVNAYAAALKEHGRLFLQVAPSGQGQPHQFRIITQQQADELRIQTTLGVSEATRNFNQTGHVDPTNTPTNGDQQNRVVLLGPGIKASGAMRDENGILDRASAQAYYQRMGHNNIQILRNAGQTQDQTAEWIEKIRANPDKQITLDAFSGSIGSLKRAWGQLSEEERKRIVINASGIRVNGNALANQNDFPGAQKFTEHMDQKSGHFGHYKDRLAALEAQQQQQPRRAALLAAGTNDWNDEERAYQGILRAARAIQARGEDPTLVLPARLVKGKAHAYNAALRAAQELKLKTEEPTEFGKDKDHFHLTPAAAKALKEKYPNASVYGDSNAVRLGAAENQTGFTGASATAIAERLEQQRQQQTTGTPQGIQQMQGEPKNVPHMQSGGTVGDDVQAVPLQTEVGPGKEDTALINPKGQIEALAKSEEVVQETPHAGDTETRIIPKTRTKAEEIRSVAREKELENIQEEYKAEQVRTMPPAGTPQEAYTSNMGKIKDEIAVATGYVATDAMNRIQSRIRMRKLPGDFHYDMGSANEV